LLATLARVAESRGHLREALQIIDDAVRLADESPGRLGHRYPVRVARGHILIGLDRLGEARSALGTGMRISEELGVRWALASSQVFLAFGRFIAGEWDDAMAELEASLELADEIGETYNRIYAYGMLSLISFHRNDLTRAQEAADAAVRDLADWDPGYRMTWAVWPRALILEACGEPGQALATIADIWDRCASSGLVLGYPTIGPDFVRLALAAGDTRRARDASAAVAEVASGNEVPWMTGAALRCRGLIEDDAEVLHAAAAAYARGSRPLWLALACQDAGAAYAKHRHTDHARPLLDQAIAIYERLGAARNLASAEAILREMGIRRGRRGTRGRPRTGWRSLTPAERTVAGLVAEGLSNPQIGERLYVSRRTVQAHLAHVFAKLDIISRAQLAALATQHRGDQA
jgi:DNA-binding CsgD family transcriptional regulator